MGALRKGIYHGKLIKPCLTWLQVVFKGKLLLTILSANEMQKKKKKHSLKVRHQYPWLHSFFGTAFMDNFDVAAPPKVHGHASTYTNEKGNFELLRWHGLDEESLAIFSWGKAVGWNVTAEQLKLGKAIPRDFYTRNSRLQTDCRRCGTWSVLELPGMNNGVTLSFSLKAIIPIPHATPLPGGKRSPSFAGVIS